MTLGSFNIGLLLDWVGAQNALLICLTERLIALILACWTWSKLIARQTLPSAAF